MPNIHPPPAGRRLAAPLRAACRAGGLASNRHGMLGWVHAQQGGWLDHMNPPQERRKGKTMKTIRSQGEEPAPAVRASTSMPTRPRPPCRTSRPLLMAAPAPPVAAVATPRAGGPPAHAPAALLPPPLP